MGIVQENTNYPNLVPLLQGNKNSTSNNNRRGHPEERTQNGSGKNMQKTSDHKNMQAVVAPRKNVVGAGGPWVEDSSGSDSECIQLIPEQK